MPNYSGTSGADNISGSNSADTIWAKGGNDVVHGNGGSDTIGGASGNDKLYGDDGNDVIFGGGGSDNIYGGNQNDELYGGAQNDAIYGGSGNDELNGGSGDDYMVGGSGSDTFYFSGTFGDDRIADFSVTTDTLSFSGVSELDIIVNWQQSGDSVLVMDIQIDAGGGNTVDLLYGYPNPYASGWIQGEAGDNSLLLAAIEGVSPGNINIIWDEFGG